jgi:hypothetical protein
MLNHGPVHLLTLPLLTEQTQQVHSEELLTRDLVETPWRLHPEQLRSAADRSPRNF